ncbi:MAG: DUF4124 domain-containing protein [Comamonadaceae bacterium]|nr:MAG: DUF4124 domain-containing protein [Comamonadaceae bacterium]
MCLHWFKRFTMLLRSLLPAIAVLAAAASGTVQAQVHRCVDEQGKISFSDTVCNGTRAQKVFGANASAKPWQEESYRQVRVAQSGTGAGPSSGGRPATVSTPPR